MDASTATECAAIEDAAGGRGALAAHTGSRSYERFTLAQILKVACSQPAAWDATERVSLISSLLASVLLGEYAPIDASDGSGMSLLQLPRTGSGAMAPDSEAERLAWWDRLLVAFDRPRCSADGVADIAAPGLVAKLGGASGPSALVPSATVLGPLARYFVDAYGFNPACVVAAWSGDNPCALAGLGLSGAGDVAVSLGTSDTVFGLLHSPTPGDEGHVFVSPVTGGTARRSGACAAAADNPPDDDDGSGAPFMAMLCYRNGSLTRERVRDAALAAVGLACDPDAGTAGDAWARFNSLLRADDAAAAGNGGRLAFFLDAPEITPLTAAGGDFRFTVSLGGGAGRGSDSDCDAAVRVVPLPPGATFGDPAAEVRAAVEGRFLSMRLRAGRLGLPSPAARVVATGGGAANAALLQVLADVWGAPVYVPAPGEDAEDSGRVGGGHDVVAAVGAAAAGAAYRAAHAWAAAHAAPAAGGAGGPTRALPFASVLKHGVGPALEAAKGVRLQRTWPPSAAAAASAAEAEAAAAVAGRDEHASHLRGSAFRLRLAASPRAAAHAVYTSMLPAVAEAEALMVAQAAVAAAAGSKAAGAP